MAWRKQLDVERSTVPMTATPVPDFRHVEALFGSAEGVAYPPRIAAVLAMDGLDSAYRLLLPFFALLLGTVVLPHSGRLMRFLRLSPMPRSVLFAVFALALAAVLVLTFALQLVANGIAVFVVDRSLATLRPLLHYHGILFLYTAGFACLGLLLSAMMRYRSTAILLGMVLCALFTVVLPAVSIWSLQAYASANYEALRDASLAGTPVLDPLYHLIRMGSYTSASLHISCRALFERIYHDPLHPTQPQRVNTVQHATQQLAASLRSLVWKLAVWPTGFLLLGSYAFARREEWS